MNKQEWVNVLTTLAPIIISTLLAPVVFFVKNKYFIFFVVISFVFAPIITGLIIIFRKEVFIKTWLTTGGKLCNGFICIVLGIVLFVYCRHDIYDFIVNNILNN